MARKKHKEPSEDDLNESTQMLLAALRASVIAEFSRLTEAGLNPYHLRYCALTAHLVSMADLIGASGHEEDRDEMMRFVSDAGMTMVGEISEQVAMMSNKLEGRLN